MSEWKEYKLGEVTEYINRGVTPSYSDEGVIVLNQKCIREGQVKFEQSRFTSIEKKKILSEKYLQSYDILINSTGQGTLGRVGQIKKINVPTTVDSHVTIVRTKKNHNPVFLGYVLKSKQSLIEDLAEGTTGQTELSRHKVAEIPILLPNYTTQTTIAEILSSLDDKIELNNKINKELETLAQVLFKQWFIDFDFPNQNGEPYKSSGGAMVDSELGEIPKGWEVGYLNQIAELHKKNIKPFENPDTIYFHYSLPEYDVNQMPKNELGDKILSSKYEVVEHSVLVSKLNPVTPRIWPIFQPDKNSICSTEFQILKPLSVQLFPFLYCLCSSKAYTSSLQSKVTGTSGSHQRVNPKDLIDYEMVLPPTSIVNNFYDFVYDSLKMIQENRQEIVKLTKLRDTLLPKLISGELEINEISK